MSFASPRRLLLACALTAPLALGACTAQSSTQSANFKGAKKSAADVVTKLSDFAEDRKSAAICDQLLTSRLAEQLAKAGGGDCKKAVDTAIRNADYTRVAVDTVELNGNDRTATRAVLTTKVGDNPKRGLVLLRDGEKSAWRIDALEVRATQTKATPPATTPRATTPK